MFVAVSLFFFAFSTILGWNLFGKINMAYLFGQKSTVVYTVIALVFIFLGTLTSSDLVWELSDMFNNLMVIPNAIALFALTGLVVKHVNGTPEADRWEEFLPKTADKKSLPDQGSDFLRYFTTPNR